VLLLYCLPIQVAEVAQILDFLSTQTAIPIVGISGGSAVVIPHKVRTRCCRLILLTHTHTVIITATTCFMSMSTPHGTDPPASSHEDRSGERERSVSIAGDPTEGVLFTQNTVVLVYMLDAVSTLSQE